MPGLEPVVVVREDHGSNLKSEAFGQGFYVNGVWNLTHVLASRQEEGEDK